MNFSRATCPHCLLTADMVTYQRLVFCPVCGPIPPEDAPNGYADILRRMQTMADRMAAHEAQGRQLRSDLADLMQAVSLELWAVLTGANR